VHVVQIRSRPRSLVASDQPDGKPPSGASAMAPHLLQTSMRAIVDVPG
jgi:hypothetical protein